MKKPTAATILITFSLVTGSILSAEHATSNPFDHPCKSEGSNGCFWDAEHMGNHEGRSYVVTKDGQVFYFSPSMSEHKDAFPNE